MSKDFTAVASVKIFFNLKGDDFGNVFLLLGVCFTECDLYLS